MLIRGIRAIGMRLYFIMPNREEKLESGALLAGACVTGVSLN